MLETNDLCFSLIAVHPLSFRGRSPRASVDDAAGRAGRDPQREEIRTYFDGGDALACERGGGEGKGWCRGRAYPRKALTCHRMIQTRQLSGST